MSSTGSTALIEVVPTVATTISGEKPSIKIGVYRFTKARDVHRAVWPRGNANDTLQAQAGHDRVLIDKEMGQFGPIDPELFADAIQADGYFIE